MACVGWSGEVGGGGGDTKAKHGSVISRQNRFLSYQSKTLLSYQGKTRFCHIKAKFTSNSITPRQNSVLSYQGETHFCHTTAKFSSVISRLNSLSYQGKIHFCRTKAKHVCHIKAKLTSANHNSKSGSLFTVNNSVRVIR